MAQPDPGPLIGVAELAQLLSSDAAPVLVDCRFVLADPAAGERAWRDAHLPGAHYLHLERDLSGPRTVTGGRHPLPGAADFERTMRRVGLDTGRLLVALDDSRGAYAARLWWLARYFGHRQVRVLDGGIAAWRASGRTLTTERPVCREGNFTARENQSLAVDFDFLLGRPSGVVLVDAREARRFEGVEEPIDPVAGHIPGACNRPWTEATDADGFFLPSARQATRWAGFAPGAQIVAYCGSGVTACVNLLSLELAGIHGARLYPGSWSDWCARPGAPVETGPGSGENQPR